MRAQSAIEFLTTYSWAFLLLGIFVATITVFFFSPSQGVQTYIPESCYIGPSLPCSQALMLTNSIGSTFMVVFQNNLGVPLSFLPTNALQVFPSYYQNSSYFGNCIPLNAISGATVICNATSSTKTSAGSQLNPRFILNYKICGTTCSQKIYSTIYNSSGSAVVVVAPYKSLLYTVGVSMTNNGQMVVGGIRYTSASNVVFISGLNYNLYANPASGFTFNSWIIGGNTVIGNSMLQSTYVSSNGPGTIQATFH